MHFRARARGGRRGNRGTGIDGDGDFPGGQAPRLWALEQAVGLWPRLPRESQGAARVPRRARVLREEDAGVSRKPAKEARRRKRGAEESRERACVRRHALDVPVDGLATRRARVRASALLAANVKARRAAAVAAAEEAAAEPNKKAGARARGSPAGLAGGGGRRCAASWARREQRAALVDDMPRGVRGGPRLAVLALHARRAGGEGGEGEGRTLRVGGAGRRAPASARSPCCR